MSAIRMTIFFVEAVYVLLDNFEHIDLARDALLDLFSEDRRAGSPLAVAEATMRFAREIARQPSRAPVLWDLAADAWGISRQRAEVQ